jgi:hypothetical protein
MNYPKDDEWFCGWDSMVAHTKRSRSNLMRLRKEMIKKGIVIISKLGRPPRPTVQWNKSALNEFLRKKESKK